MPKVHKTIGEARKNLSDSVAYIPARYEASTARADWATPAASAEATANYTAGIAESEAKGLRVKGIVEAGDAKYKLGCKEKGAKVIGARISAALPIYEREFSPVLSAMNAASDGAPARTRDWRSNVTNRLFPVIEAARRVVGKE